MIKTNLTRCGLAASMLASLCLSAFGANTAAVARQSLSKNTPAFAATSKNLGPADATQNIEVSLWLNLHNAPELEALAQSLYTPGSPQFHQWLTPADFAARFAPTAQEVKTVQSFLTSQGLKLVSVGPSNLFVRAGGTVGAVSKAFNVSISNFQVGSDVIRANTSDPEVTGPAAALVKAVQGLDNAQMKTHNVSRADIVKKLPHRNGPQTAANPAVLPAGFFPNVCFDGVKTEVLNYGSYPIAQYKGLHYFGNDNTASCGYTPQDIYTAYNLNALHKAGYDGTGQTIVIEDWCGSGTILQEANTFSSFFGLPPLTSANFSQVFYPTRSTCESPNIEIDIDVEWAHAIAPGASIILLVPPSAGFQDTDAAQVYAEFEGLGNVLSGSYGAPELYVSSGELVIEYDIAQIGAVLGISTNFSTGDEGDYTFDNPKLNPATVSVPASVPYNTAVGGISLALNSNNSINWQTGWGTNIDELSFDGVVYPPSGYFNFGSGGGPSGFYAKPWYQSKLPGTTRQVPDISWLADPYTGAVIVASSAFQFPPEIFEVYGGTSLACPMFSALWAIADQEAGTSLGQAAPNLYGLPASVITDILPHTSPNNVNGWLIPSPGASKVFYSATELAQPLEHTKTFTSAIWDYPDYPGSELLITFGTDSGLTITKGWDNVTGNGVPNGKAFADYFKK